MSLRRPFSSLLLLVGVLALPLVGCGDDSADGSTSATGTGTGTGGAGTGTATGTGGGGGEGGGSGIVYPEAICRPASAWGDGVQAFREATSDWQLDAIGAAGTRLSAVDWDGDGWTDLIVRTGADLRDDFGEEGVRGTWLLRNRGDGTFEDVTEASGFRASREDDGLGRPGDVMAFADVDQDGDLDAITAPQERAETLPAHTEVLLNDGDGTFSLGADDNGLHFPLSDVEAPAAIVFVDVNFDGFVDVWSPRTGPNGVMQQARLFYGNGDGTFFDVTSGSLLISQEWIDIATMNQGLAHANAWSGAACDLNDDGNLELLTASYGRAPDHLWLASGPEGNFGFTNISVESGYAYDDRMDWSDNESARCWCMLNRDDEGCADVPEPEHIPCNNNSDAFRWNHTYDREPFRLGGNSAATMCGDVDNDGDVDLLTTAIVHWDVGSSSDPAELLLNTGEATPRFERPGPEVTGLARSYDYVDWNEGIMSGSLFDFDNDGWLDVYWGGSDYPGQRGLLYRQDAPAHFVPVPIDVGIDHHRSHGSAVADFDRDGDLDVVVGHSTSRCEVAPGYPDTRTPCYASQQVRFFENVIGQNGNHLAVKLEGTVSNRAAIGARVTVTANGVTQTRDVGGGHGHFGAQDDLVVFFGLGEACEAEVTVRWPTGGAPEETHRLTANYRWSIVQGQLPVAVVAP